VETVEEREHVRGELTDGEDGRKNGRLGDAPEDPFRQVVAQLGDAVTAKIRNDGADLGKKLDERAPEFAIDGSGMKKDDGQTRSGVGVAEVGSVREVELTHTPGGYIPGRGGVSSGMPIQAAR
jgi:hypothetical protein